MEIDYNNLDLRNKTAFDFTDDPAILEAIDLDLEDKERFIKFALPIAKAFSLIDYAEYIDDRKLILAIETEFSKEFSEFFNE